MNLLVPMLLADAAFSGILVLLWWMRRRYVFALYWGLGQIALAINTLGSSLGLGFGAITPAGFPQGLLIATPLLAMAIHFYWRGCLHFCGRSFAPRRSITVAAAILAAIVLSHFYSKGLPEYLAIAALSGSLTGCGILICRHRPEHRFLAWLFWLRALMNVLIGFHFYSGLLTGELIMLGGLVKLMMALGLIHAVTQLYIQRTEKIADSTGSGFMLIDSKGRIELANARIRDMLGLPPGDLSAQSLASLFPGSRIAATAGGPDESGNGFPASEEIEHRGRDGQRLPLLLLWGTFGEHFERMLLLQVFDDRERKAHELTLRTAAQTDPVTGLLNRSGLQQGLDEALRASLAEGSECAIFFIDLDHFNRVNDSFGHSVGDELLRLAAERLARIIDPTKILARFGGDEFVVVAGTLPPSAEHEEAVRAAGALLAAFDTPFELGNMSLVITASIGVAIAPLHGMDAETLIKSADQAMYAAKASGRHRIVLFDESMDTRVRDAILIDEALRTAIGANEFRLVFQPIVDAHSGEWVKAEALIRWNSGRLGVVQPDRFIPVAEENGMIVEIGNWVLIEACRTVRSWIDASGRELKVAVNVSALQLLDRRFLDNVDSALKASSLPPRLLELEITERVLIDDENAVSTVIAALKARGISFALDDFGTGYSALSYLHRFPLDTLKIDRGFIFSLEQSPSRQALVRSIVAMAGALSMKTVAEGVETEAQAGLLREAGCSYMQGYLYAKPLERSAILAALSAERPA
ncbi:putative bifunctional diguanylate cyclase/phosphodiesterase [Niveibacterium terrae]|uniref:putative bifunctional diguanylate cyclase/phosphodiesterase n=1 Tax=Niveibacterium terrae TaxID=3373598 RepID=UPI003A8D6151